MTDRFVEMLAFFFGSCYFVSGSYPETSILIDDEFDDQSVGSEDPEDQQSNSNNNNNNNKEKDDSHEDDDNTGHIMMSNRVPNNIPYDEGNDDSDEEETKQQYSIREPNVISQNKSNNVSHNGMGGGDTSPSTKNPLTFGL